MYKKKHSDLQEKLKNKNYHREILHLQRIKIKVYDDSMKLKIIYPKFKLITFYTKPKKQ